MQRMRQSIHNYLCMCMCVYNATVGYAKPSEPQVSPHAGNSRHSRASVRLCYGNTNHTQCTPLFEAQKHGNLGGNVCVCVGERGPAQRVEGPKFVVADSTHTDTKTHTVKIPITFSQLSPLEQLCLCGCCSSLSGLFGSCSVGH